MLTLDKDKITGVLKISGKLDIDAANELRLAFLDCFLHDPEVAADLSEVEVCDTAGLQVLLAGREEAAVTGKGFRLIAASEAVVLTATALGFSVDQPGSGQPEEYPNAE
jgi:anti-anti-sigma factor